MGFQLGHEAHLVSCTGYPRPEALCQGSSYGGARVPDGADSDGGSRRCLSGLEVYLIQAFGGVDGAFSLFLKLCELYPVVGASRHGDAFEGERTMQRLIEEALRNMGPDAAMVVFASRRDSVDDVLALQLICDVFYTQDRQRRNLV